MLEIRHPRRLQHRLLKLRAHIAKEGVGSKTRATRLLRGLERAQALRELRIPRAPERVRAPLAAVLADTPQCDHHPRNGQAQRWQLLDVVHRRRIRGSERR